MPEQRIEAAVRGIRNELREQLEHFKKEGNFEAQRLNARTRYDIEMLQEVGYCSGVENYSRHLSGRKPGEPPDTLYDFFPEDFMLVIDESHVTVPQVRAMWAGDRSRKTTLVEHGFRLPSALDNRPMTFDEWESKNRTVVYVSATLETMNSIRPRRWSSRLFDQQVCSTLKSKSCRQQVRCLTCSSKSKNVQKLANEC